jgi:hypothetical protein
MRSGRIRKDHQTVVTEGNGKSYRMFVLNPVGNTYIGGLYKDLGS